MTKFNIKQSHKKVILVCPSHGEFSLTPSSHLCGSGCPKCAHERLPGGYNEDRFQQTPELKIKPAKLYFLKFYSNTETFFKVGITTRKIENRFYGTNHGNYTLETLVVIETTLYEAYKIEQNILATHNRYTPEIKFKGWTECIVDDVSNILKN